MPDHDKPDVIPFAEHAITRADSGPHLGGAAWQPIETALADRSHRAFIVTDGQYLKKVRWDQDDGCWTERIEGVAGLSSMAQITTALKKLIPAKGLVTP
jgi:hypothetical protein